MTWEIERGSFGYIKRKKKRQILYVIGLFAVAALMFIVGLFLNKFDRANVCTVLAILMVLPMVKMLVIFIVFVPFKSVPKEIYDKVVAKAGEDSVVMTDMVITSEDKPMNLDFVIITDNQVLGMLGKKNQDVAYIENYLKKFLKNNKCNGFTVKIFSDYDKFLENIGNRAFEPNDDQVMCFELIRTLVVK